MGNIDGRKTKNISTGVQGLQADALVKVVGTCYHKLITVFGFRIYWKRFPSLGHFHFRIAHLFCWLFSLQANVPKANPSGKGIRTGMAQWRTEKNIRVLF